MARCWCTSASRVPSLPRTADRQPEELEERATHLAQGLAVDEVLDALDVGHLSSRRSDSFTARAPLADVCVRPGELVRVARQSCDHFLGIELELGLQLVLLLEPPQVARTRPEEGLEHPVPRVATAL